MHHLQASLYFDILGLIMQTECTAGFPHFIQFCENASNETIITIKMTAYL